MFKKYFFNALYQERRQCALLFGPPTRYNDKVVMSAECWWCALQVRPSSIIDRRTALCARQTHQWREADTRRSSLLAESVNKVESRRCSVGVFDHCSTDSCNWQVVSVPSWPATTRRRKVSGPIHLAVATTANTGYVFTLFVCLFVC